MSVRVVIADDHVMVCQGLRTLLESEPDIRVVAEARTGPQCLQIVRETGPDVLLLDLSLPELPGPRVAEALLAERPGIRIVVVTMHEDTQYLEELLRAGVRGYVLKQSSRDILVHAIRAVHRGDLFVDPIIAGRALLSRLEGAPGGGADRLVSLNSREREVLSHLAMGHTNGEIARKLDLSPRTVESHRAKLMSKMGFKSRAELVQFAIANRLMKSGPGEPAS